MCRSTVARVVAVDGSDAIVEFDGVQRRASALVIPDLTPGELVLIGLGTVLGRVSTADLEALRAIERRAPHAAPQAESTPAPG